MTQNTTVSQWKILIFDDDTVISELTEIAIRNIKFQGKTLNTLFAKSEQETYAVLEENHDIAVIILDLDLGYINSGYHIVHHIRKNLCNSSIRIILKSNQRLTPYICRFMEDFDLTEYLDKSTSDIHRIYLSTYSSLRIYHAIVEGIKKSEQYQDELHKKALQLETFRRFVPQALTPSKEGCSMDQLLGVSEKSKFGVLFCDIRGFTSFAESISSTHCFNFLNSYFSVVSPEVIRYNGFIYQLLGDGILALYPCEKQNDARTILHSAVNIQDALLIYNKGRLRAGYQPIRVGIGANMGEVAIGISGTSHHMSATAFGSTVNLASRCDDLGKQLSVGIVITENIMNELTVKDQFLTRYLGRVRAKGLSQLISIFEVFNADEPKLRDEKLKNRPITDEAFALFNDGREKESIQLFESLKQNGTIDPLPATVLPLLKTQGSMYYKNYDHTYLKSIETSTLQSYSEYKNTTTV